MVAQLNDRRFTWSTSEFDELQNKNRRGAN
jgi:hypothetical protein